ncbi:MAG: tetratricopeptide repeat protein, partial [Candidatus Hodarchaeales archaeon]
MGIGKELGLVTEFIYKGQYEKALLKVARLENIAGLAAVDRLQCQLLKSEVLTLIGNYDQAIVIANHSFKESEELGKPLQKVDSIIRNVFPLIVSRKYGEASALIEMGEVMLEEITQVGSPEIEKRKAELYQFKSRILKEGGELIGALEFGQKSLSILKELNLKLEIALSLQAIGSVYRESGELDQALEYFQKSKTIGEELGHHLLLSLSYYFIGGTYLSRGDLDQASEYYQKILS